MPANNIVDAKVESIEPYGIYLRGDVGRILVLIPDVTNDPINDLNQLYAIGETVRVRLLYLGSKSLFRGVPVSGTEKARLGAMGIAKPRGTRLDYDALRRHVEGADIDSGVTSWSTSRDQARRFAGQHGTIIGGQLKGTFYFIDDGCDLR